LCAIWINAEAIQDYTNKHSNGTLEMSNNDPGLAGIFATYPASYLSAQGGLGDQILGTMLLLVCVCAITDKKNTQVPPSLAPMYVGFTILGIGISFGASMCYVLRIILIYC